MRSVELLVDEVRLQTDNRDFTADTGISDNEIISYLNKAQNSIYAAISTLEPTPAYFVETSIVSVSPNVSTYDIPFNCYMGQQIAKVQFSETGQERNYYNVHPTTLHETEGQDTGLPDMYVRIKDQIQLLPTPSRAGSLRLRYQKKLPWLDVRRVKIAAVTLDTNALTITSLTVETGDLDSDLAENILKYGYVTFVDRDGIRQMNRIPIDDVNITSGVLTVEPGFVYQSGETLAVGNWMCLGKDSSNVSELPEICEQYLVDYACKRVYMRDSNGDSVTQDQDLKEAEVKILEAFKNPDPDVHSVPILDDSYIYRSRRH